MGRQRDIRNPRTGRADHRVRFATAGEVQAAAAGLRAAQPDWEALGLEGRGEALHAWADALQALQPQMVQALIQDTGRSAESQREAAAMPPYIRHWAQRAPQLLAPPPPRPSATAPIQIHSLRIPHALVGVISPWNFPLLLSLIDAVPALAAGCAVLLKPSEVTPRFAQVVRQSLQAAPPLDAVAEVLVGDGDAGEAVCGQVDMVCFTGSVATGRKVAELAGRRMIPASLELGGKDAAIVFADADLPRTARALCWGGLTNAGQACQAIERIYVQREAFQPFAQLLVQQVERLQLNDRDPARGQLGPIIQERQAETVRRHLQDALDRGARCLTGGQVVQGEGGGLWCQPTVLVDVSQDMAVMREETFASVLPLAPFDDEDEAVALANGTEYGLSGAVFSGDRERALRVAGRLQAGAVSVNDCALTAAVHDGEKHSFKSSGLGGSRMGDASIWRFVRTRALLENPEGGDDPWWFVP